MRFINIRRHEDRELLPHEVAEQRKTLYTSLFIPFFLVAILWIVKIFEVTGETVGFLGERGFAPYGIIPRTITGLRGILFAPFIHGDWAHLASNSFPLLVLGFLVFNSYKQVAVKVLIYVTFFGNILLWIVGRTSSHIGASGVIYGLAFFLFFSGVFRKDMRSIALALLVAFLYGSIVWGIFPTTAAVSFEGHAMGALVGTVLAWLYREIGRAPEITWEDEDDWEDEDRSRVFPAEGNGTDWRSGVREFRYTIRPKDEG